MGALSKMRIPRVDIVAGRTLTCRTLPHALKQSIEGSGSFVDLSRLQDVDSAGLAAVAAGLDQTHASLVPPKDSRVLAHLRETGLLNGPRSDLSDNHSVGVRHPDSLVGRYTSEDGLDALSDNLMQLFERDRAQPVYDAIYEIAVNVVDHSRGNAGFIALEDSPKSDEVAFAISDTGRGVRASLAEAGPVPSDYAALVIAAKLHMSSTGRPGRGRGITGVIELTGDYRGSVTMFSGSSAAEFRRGHWDPSNIPLSSPFRGTLVHVKLRLGGRRSA